MSSIVVTDHDAHPAAGRYYNMCSWEQTGASGRLGLGSVFPIAQFTMEAVLDQIAGQSSGEGGTIVIVCHGNTGGLIFPLVHRHARKASAQALNMLSGTDDDAAIAQPLSVPEAAIARLRGKMRAAQAKSLDRVEIRGCRVGAEVPTMRAIQRFFGARCVGAPVIYNAYTTCDANTNNPNYDYATHYSGTNRYHWQVGGGGHVGFRFQRQAQTRFQLRNVRASSPAAFRRWMIQNYPIRLHQVQQTATGPVDTYRDMRAGEVDPDPYDDVPMSHTPIHMQVGDGDRLTLPLESSYRTNLAEVCGAPPSLEFDLSDPSSGLDF